MGAVMQDRIARFTDFIGRADALDEIVQRMCGVAGPCEGLPEICRSMDLPYGKVLLWLMADQMRYAEYEKALEVQGHQLVSEVLDIVDDSRNDFITKELQSGEMVTVPNNEAIARSKLRVDARFKLAGFHAPKKYIERKEMKVEHRHDLAERLVAARGRVARQELDVTDADIVMERVPAQVSTPAATPAEYEL